MSKRYQNRVGLPPFSLYGSLTGVSYSDPGPKNLSVRRVRSSTFRPKRHKTSQRVDGFHGAMSPEQLAPAIDSYLRIQIKTPVRQKPGLHNNSAGLSASCRKGSLTQHGIQGWDPEPESHATSGGHKPSAWAELQESSQFYYTEKQKLCFSVNINQPIFKHANDRDGFVNVPGPLKLVKWI